MPDQTALIADIGGTNVRFAMVRPGQEPGQTMAMRCADFPGPAEAVEAYLAKVGGERPRRAAFDIACPVLGDWVELTNSPWRFSIEAVRRQLGLDVFRVVNDFTAVALSVRYLGPGHLVKAGGGEPVPGAPIAVLGPGTGLGVSALVQAPSGEWSALATEGGHATMCAADEREAALLAVLRKRFDHLSIERVLSGPGLVNLYEAAAAVEGRPAVYTTPDAISQRGLDGSDPICKLSLQTFFAMLGTVAGNLALTLGARGGVYIAGGILPRMVDAFLASSFRERFEAKGRFQPYLAPVPAWLVVHPHAAFVGLAGLAME